MNTSEVHLWQPLLETDVIIWVRASMSNRHVNSLMMWPDSYSTSGTEKFVSFVTSSQDDFYTYGKRYEPINPLLTWLRIQEALSSPDPRCVLMRIYMCWHVTVCMEYTEWHAVGRCLNVWCVTICLDVACICVSQTRAGALKTNL